MKKFILFAIFFLMTRVCLAKQDDYSRYYEVNLDADLPDIDALDKEFRKQNTDYDPNYILSWNMGFTFKSDISNLITAFGGSEVRIKNANEDEFLEQIASLPKEYYPYIGPNLHASQGISEKILNMPGIKETKNKFPDVIAPQLQDIEDLEFLSPHLYILLMPQMWPSNQKPLEQPRYVPAKFGKDSYDAAFFANVLKKVPDQGFGGAARSGKVSLPDKLRTLNPTKDSLLTSADVMAFVNTLPNVRKFATLENVVKIGYAGTLLDYWERKNNQSLMVNGLKDVVNPCQRLALKIKWAGLETNFLSVVAPQAFNLKSWAYTCDKTIKAYRLARMPLAYVTTLDSIKKKTLHAYFNTLNPKWRQNQYMVLQSLSEMYKAPMEDVVQALKNETAISKELIPFGSTLITSPLAD